MRGADGKLKPSLLFGGLVFAAALVVRLVHLLAFAGATPFFDPAPWNTPDNPLDPGEYDRWGMQITNGDPWWTDHGQGVYFQSPVYPYFVALTYLLAGGRSYFTVTVVQVILGAVSVALIALLARRFLSAPAGRLAAVAGSIYAPAIFYESFLLKETLASFLLTVALVVTVLEFGPGGGGLQEGIAVALRRRWLRWLGIGFVWGAAVAAWPLLGPVAAASIGWIVWRVLRPAPGADNPGTAPSSEARGQAAMLTAGLLLCGALLAVFPCTLRNVIGEGRFVLVSDAGPRNWQVGNSVNSTGTYIDFPREPLPVLSGRFVRLYLAKLSLFFRGDEIPQVTDFNLLHSASPVLRLPIPRFGFLAPFFLAGLPLAFFVFTRPPPGREPAGAAAAGAPSLPGERVAAGLFPFVALGVLYPASVALFFVVGRFRLPLTPALVLFTALTFEELRGLIRRRTGLPPRLWLLAGVLLAAFLVNRDTPLPRGAYPFHHAYARYYLDMGMVARANSRHADALDYFERVRAVQPRHYKALAHQGKATVYLGGLKRDDLALMELQLSLAVDPQQQEAERTREIIRKLEERLPAPPADR